MSRKYILKFVLLIFILQISLGIALAQQATEKSEGAKIQEQAQEVKSLEQQNPNPKPFAIKIMGFTLGIGELALAVAILTFLVNMLVVLCMYHLYYKGRGSEKKKEENKVKQEKEKEERQFKDEVKQRLSNLEGEVKILTQLYPQLKALGKLEIFDKLRLTEDDIRKTVSETLKTTGITPEAIESRLERLDKKIEEKYSEQDKKIAGMVTQRLDKIDEQFGKPVGNAPDYLILGNAEYYNDNYQKALELYEKAIKINPKDEMVWNNRGNALYKFGRYEDALASYNEAIKINSRYAYAWNNKGFVLSDLGRFEDALKAFDKAIELKPDYTLAWSNKGFILAKYLGRPSLSPI